MGCDGGTIPTRDEMVRRKKKPEKKDKKSEMASKWKSCAISQEQLQKPIVACQLGKLYKKDKVIEFLLDKSKFEQADNFDHLKGLKDIKELQLTDNSSFEKGKAEVGDGYVDHAIGQYICPVTGIEMSGTFRFAFSWNCGCVVSERALKEVKSDVCHKCQKSCKQEDMVILNGTEDDVKQMRLNMEDRRTKAKLEKKSKKHKIETVSQSSDEPETKAIKADPDTKVIKTDPDKSDVASTSKAKTAIAQKNGKLVNGKKEETAKGIQKDPGATKAFKSLFTTSEKAKNQPKAHWVTYNPCYY